LVSRINAADRPRYIEVCDTILRTLPRETDMVSETDKAYAAGLFDGEGYVGILPRTRDSLTRYLASVVIANTDRTPLDWICEKFGGRVQVTHPKPTPKETRRRTLYSWYIRGSRVGHLDGLDGFLTAIKPYSQIKTRQIEVVQKFRQFVPKSFREYTSELEAIQRACYEECKSLKCRTHS
jgi:hypothetical protein